MPSRATPLAPTLSLSGESLYGTLSPDGRYLSVSCDLPSGRVSLRCFDTATGRAAFARSFEGGGGSRWASPERLWWVARARAGTHVEMRSIAVPDGGDEQRFRALEQGGSTQVVLSWSDRFALGTSYQLRTGGASGLTLVDLHEGRDLWTRRSGELGPAGTDDYREGPFHPDGGSVLVTRSYRCSALELDLANASVRRSIDLDERVSMRGVAWAGRSRLAALLQRREGLTEVELCFLDLDAGALAERVELLPPSGRAPRAHLQCGLSADGTRWLLLCGGARTGLWVAELSAGRVKQRAELGEVLSAAWVDSGTALTLSREGAGLELACVDLETGVVRSRRSWAPRPQSPEFAWVHASADGSWALVQARYEHLGGETLELALFPTGPLR